MNKSEAINAMQHGKYLTHRFFGDDEFISMKEGYIVTEEGYKCTPSSFWNDRTDANWDEDWSIKDVAILIDDAQYVHIPFTVTSTNMPVKKENRFSHATSRKVSKAFGSISNFNRR